MRYKPNLFIVGAPKSGTTSLCHYIEEHKNVCFSYPKEAKYFHTDFNRNHRLYFKIEDYLSIFKDINANTKWIAEGTVWYLYSKKAIKNIIKFNKDAKFIVMIRNPIDLAYSLHSQLLYGGDEDENDFQKAWYLQEKRKRGLKIPKFSRDAKSLQYGEIAKVGKQLERMYRIVNKDNVHIIFFDELKKSPKDVYDNVLNFLNLENDKRLNFPVINNNKIIKFEMVANFFHYVNRLKRKIGIYKSFNFWNVISPFISHERKREKLDKNFEKELKLYFKNDIELLSQITNKNLNHWYE